MKNRVPPRGFSGGRMFHLQKIITEENILNQLRDSNGYKPINIDYCLIEISELQAMKILLNEFYGKEVIKNTYE